MKHPALILLLLVLSGSLGLAKEKKAREQSVEEAFKALDTTGDSLISLEEFLVGKPDKEKATADFQNADADKDGRLTLEEFSTTPKRAKKERKKKKE
ncbi:MAG: EF-hand superfamily [Verrucomicrobia bacterium]|nr:MAG: EF-hand superfamily [Verrucomicrobiota bacterium]